jgi:spermidine synthase
MGVLGLGAGVTATLARPGDTLHYYEINPLVFQIAQSEFGFYKACPADKQLFLGDGRLVLERMPDEHLDFLAMDAFSSDAVPVHLLTREAWATYRRHLKPGGILAINITNRYLNLEPVIAETASEFGWSGVVVEDEGLEESFYTGSVWALMSRDARMFERPDFLDAGVAGLKKSPGFRAWTDDYSNIIQILK